MLKCERKGQCSTNNLTLPSFGILLRDSKLPGNKNEGIGLADHNAAGTTSAAAAGATVTVDTAGTTLSSTTTTTLKPNPKNPNALALGPNIKIPPCLSLATIPTAEKTEGKESGGAAATVVARR